jgi:acyl-CoA synthetase (AMP-forming)/AMP-acid ligase II
MAARCILTRKPGSQNENSGNNGELVRLHDRLNVVAAAKPEMDFAIQGTRQLSYRLAAAESNRLAHALTDAGLQCGDRIAILARNSIEYRAHEKRIL